MAFPEDLLYSREHTWARIDGNLAVVGLTDYAQEKLGELLDIELPQVDDPADQDEPFGTLETAKGVLELIAPVSGDVVRVNDDLIDDIGLIGSDPYDTGWMIVIEMKDFSELENLLNAREYENYIEEEEELA